MACDDSNDRREKILQAAKTGRIHELKQLLNEKQEINSLITGQTALQAAITAGQSEAITFLLARGARVDIFTPGGNALITTIDARDEKIFSQLLKTPSGQAALCQVHIARDIIQAKLEFGKITEACYPPITYLAAWHEKGVQTKATDSKQDTIGRMLKVSLANRPPFWPTIHYPDKESKSLQSSRFSFSCELDTLYAFYRLQYLPEFLEYNRDLLRYALARLTGQDLKELLETFSERAAAVLISALMNLDATQDHQELPAGWQHETFLTLRMGSLFTLRCRLITGSEHLPEALSLSPAIFQDHLDRLILSELEMLRTVQEIRVLPMREGKPTELAQDGYRIIAQRIIVKITALKDGDEYAFATGWAIPDVGAHAV